MALPHPFSSVLAAILYLILFYILIIGFLQYYKPERLTLAIFKKSLVPVGIIGLAVGFWSLVYTIQQTFDAIQAAGDISPSMVAGGITSGYPYLYLGILCLIVSLVFYYFNHKKRKEAMTPPLT